MPTVVTLEGDAADGTVVRFGLDGALDRESLFQDGSATLLGLPPDVEVSFQVGCADPASVRTGTLAEELPTLSTAGTSDQFLVTTFLGGMSGPTIVDPAGRVTWFFPDDHGLEVIRSRLSRDGRSMLYNAVSAGGTPSEDSAIVRVSLDGSSVEEIPVPRLAHDFVELADGTLASLAVDIREVDGEEVRGDQIVEIAPDGAVEVVWSTFDCFDPAVDIGTDQQAGWTLANALDYDEAADRWYVSLRNFSSIVGIDRATGSCPWVFGSTAQTVSLAQDAAVFLHQHQFEVRDDSVLVMDNDGATGNVSRVLEYTLDGGVASEIWSYTADPAIFSFVLGEPVRLADGDTMVDWAVGGQFDRVNPDGSVQWQLVSEMGLAFGFFTPHARLSP
jgi:hypothetical protein